MMFLKFKRFPAGTPLYVRPAQVEGFSIESLTAPYVTLLHLSFGGTAVWGAIEDIDAMMLVVYTHGVRQGQDLYDARVKRAIAEAEAVARKSQEASNAGTTPAQ